MASLAVLRDAALRGLGSKCVRLSERERAKGEPLDSDEISGKKHGMEGPGREEDFKEDGERRHE